MASPAPELTPTTAEAPPPQLVATPTGMPGALADCEKDPQLDAQLLPEVFEPLGSAVSSSQHMARGEKRPHPERLTPGEEREGRPRDRQPERPQTQSRGVGPSLSPSPAGRRPLSVLHQPDPPQLRGAETVLWQGMGEEASPGTMMGLHGPPGQGMWVTDEIQVELPSHSSEGEKEEEPTSKVESLYTPRRQRWALLNRFWLGGNGRRPDRGPSRRGGV